MPTIWALKTFDRN